MTLARGAAQLGRTDVVEERGFFILPEDLFENVRARGRSNPNLNETLARVFGNIEASSIGTPSERDFKGLFEDLDVNSNKLGPTVAKRNDKLVKLLDAIGSLPLGGAFGENTNDLFGDAYEYLMNMYASSAGKSGGEYYTPQEVSELLASIAVAGKTEVNKVYDPACGSGSLLLKFAKVLGPDKVRNGFFGQEINLTTYNLARINMILHDVPYEKFDIAHGDTLTDPAHWDDEPFEAIVSNPPYSLVWAGDADVTLINDERYARRRPRPPPLRRLGDDLARLGKPPRTGGRHAWSRSFVGSPDPPERALREAAPVAAQDVPHDVPPVGPGRAPNKPWTAPSTGPARVTDPHEHTGLTT